MLTFEGESLREVVLPLGGIGTGSVGLSGAGELIDWELSGRQNKGSINEYTHFAVKAERDGQVLDARVLHGDVTKNLSGAPGDAHHHSWGAGHGVNRTSLAGLAHFPSVVFKGEFPVAELDFSGTKMPAEIKLTAFNPFIPSDEDNSSLPAAFFEWRVKNTSDKTTDFTIAFSCGNPFKTSDGGFNRYEKSGKLSSVLLGSTAHGRKTPEYGELRVTTDCDHVSCQEYWYRGGWFDDLTTFWREFSSPGRLKSRHYDGNDNPRGRLDTGDMCTIEAHLSLNAGEEKSFRFLLSWYYPNFTKYWDASRVKPVWEQFYVKRFSSSRAVANYCFEKWDELYGATELFKNALYSSALPEKVLEAVGANLAVLKSTTCLRLSDGTFWAFEGSNEKSGSCEGTCDHVWGYQYALPFLFPRLARSVLTADYTHNIKDSGEMVFRTAVPLGSKRWDFRACVDGQMGCVMRVFREWKISGDDVFLKKHWENVKKSLQYAWSDENRDRWDPMKTGVITGRQHHTLDMELFGASSWLTGYYLAALKAGAEMAQYLGESEEAKVYLGILRSGQRYTEEQLFNGRHYIQKIDLSDKGILEAFEKYDSGIIPAYWNDEKNEIKYQYCGGCEIDQLVSQWHAGVIGLGDIFDKSHRKSAARAIYDINFKSMRGVFNPCRVFALNDEKGTVICEWQDGEYKPQIPLPYTEECMTGFEYAAAGLMAEEGLIKEAVECTEAVRERYNGKKRNPYSEIECGMSYARSMASFAFLPIFSGFMFDMVKKQIGFAPIEKKDVFNCFWALDNVWGTAELGKEHITVNVLRGELTLRSYILSGEKLAVKAVQVDGKDAEYIKNGSEIKFSPPIDIKARLCIITDSPSE